MPNMRKKKDKIMEMRLVVDNEEERSKSCEKANNIIEKYMEYITSLK